MDNNSNLLTLKENLELLSSRKDVNSEQRSITLRSIAKIICEDEKFTNLREACDAYRSIVGYSTAESENELYDVIVTIPRFHVELLELISIGINDAEDREDQVRIAYVKNKFNDIAFKNFAKLNPLISSVLVDSPREACEAVANGSVERCEQN